MFLRLCYCFIFLLLSLASSASAQDISLERMMLLQDISPQSQAQSTPPQTHKLHMPEPVRLLIDVRSDHSDGAHDFNTLISLAKKRYIDVLSFNEHDRFTIRLGIEPFPSLLGYSQEHPSLYQTGLDAFFQDLKHAQTQTSTKLMSGTESTPGYFWEGVPFMSLSLHDAERHIITLGVTEPSQIRGLSSYSLENAYGSQFVSLVFWSAFFLLTALFLYRSAYKFALVSLLVAVGGIVFSIQITPEHKDLHFINSAQSQGLFTIWAHPGTLSGVRNGPMGVQLNTPPYNKHIFKVPADAFAAVYGDTDSNTKPGGLWDRYMMSYLRGYVSKPMWAVAAGDYHEEGMANEYLGNFPMDVWATSTNQSDVLAALRQGRMASWHMNQHQNLSVSQLYLAYNDPKSGNPRFLFSGDEADIPADVSLGVHLRELGNASHLQSLRGQWVIDGKIHQKVTLNINDNNTHLTALRLPKGKHVIRFQIPPQHGVRLETNPFLVEVR